MKAIFILLMMIPALLFGQKTAMWETKLFFEDGLGNKDSITLGHDLNANSTYNPDFGEVNIKDQPWDSVFEVRASHNVGANAHTQPEVLSKKIIGRANGGLHPIYNCLFIRETLKFFVRVKHYPLKISWNSEDYHDFCNAKNYMTPHISPFANPLWFQDTINSSKEDYACMYNEHEYVLEDLSKYKYINFVLDTISESQLDTIHGFLLNFEINLSDFSPCQGTVGVKEQNQNELLVNIYPNPANSVINLEVSDNLSWEIYDIQGKLLKRGDAKTIDIADIKNGLYILQARTDKAIVMKKFIKTE